MLHFQRRRWIYHIISQTCMFVCVSHPSDIASSEDVLLRDANYNRSPSIILIYPHNPSYTVLFLEFSGEGLGWIIWLLHQKHCTGKAWIIKMRRGKRLLPIPFWVKTICVWLRVLVFLFINQSKQRGKWLGYIEGTQGKCRMQALFHNLDSLIKCHSHSGWLKLPPVFNHQPCAPGVQCSALYTNVCTFKYNK